MRNTRENVIELLKKIRASQQRCAKHCSEDLAKTFRVESLELTMVLDLLTDNEFFNKIADIYKDE